MIKALSRLSAEAMLRFRSRQDAGDRGFVLIAAIWIAGLLAVTATAFLATTTAQIFLARNVSQGARLDAAASGMARLTAYNLAMANGPAVGKPVAKSCTWGDDIVITAVVQDQSGLIDLNTASPNLLLALLTGLSGEAEEAQQIFDAIQDYKDPDQISLSGGREVNHYDGKPYGPKNAPFETPFELDQIPQISDALFLRLQSLVTVQSQQAGVDLSKAPEELLNALKAGLQAGTELSQFNVPSSDRMFAIDVIASRKGGGSFHRRMVVNLLRQPERPFAVLEWRRANGAVPVNISSSPVGPCIIARS
jgi:general secretion pathway protein K